MPIEYKVFFSWTGSTTWTRTPFRQDEVEIAPLATAVPGGDILTMYAKDASRLWAGIKKSGVLAEFIQDTVVRYEYWKSEKSALSTWSFDRSAGMGMRTAGMTEFLQGTHRVVICRESLARNKRSIIILRASAFMNNFPFNVSMENLVDEIKQNARPEKGEGTGDAIETFITDTVVPFLSLLV